MRTFHWYVLVVRLRLFLSLIQVCRLVQLLSVDGHLVPVIHVC